MTITAVTLAIVAVLVAGALGMGFGHGAAPPEQLFDAGPPFPPYDAGTPRSEASPGPVVDSALPKRDAAAPFSDEHPRGSR